MLRRIIESENRWPDLVRLLREHPGQIPTVITGLTFLAGGCKYAPLHRIADSDNRWAELVRLLGDYPEQVETVIAGVCFQDEDSDTPLHKIADSDNRWAELVRLLGDHPEQVPIAIAGLTVALNEYGYTPLHLIANSDNRWAEWARLLRNHHDRIPRHIVGLTIVQDDDEYTPLHRIAHSEQRWATFTGLLEGRNDRALLLRQSFSIDNTNGRTFLDAYACRLSGAGLKIIQTLNELERSNEITLDQKLAYLNRQRDGWTPLMWAIQQQNSELQRTLEGFGIRLTPDQHFQLTGKRLDVQTDDSPSSEWSCRIC